MDLNTEKHAEYIVSLEQKDNVMTEHLYLNGVYWGTTCLALMNQLQGDTIVEKVIQCLKPNGMIRTCYSPSQRYRCLFCTMRSTESTLQRRENVLEFYEDVLSLRQPDGSFTGDEWGEVDTRFVYCAVSCLSLIKSLHSLDKQPTIEWLRKCQNYDGGFGCLPDTESHAAQIFCCVGALSILGALNCIDADKLGWWLAERQLPCGGLNGRPEKLEDVCYSWWVLSSLDMIGRLEWINKEKLKEFILTCQVETGGFTHRPGDLPDVFHTLFAICGLSLLGYPGLKAVNSTYCLPQDVIDRANLVY